jgi:hypothetical protein
MMRMTTNCVCHVPAGVILPSHQNITISSNANVDSASASRLIGKTWMPVHKSKPHSTPSYRCAPRSRMPLGSVVTMLQLGQVWNLPVKSENMWTHHSKIGSYLAWQREFHQRRAHKTSPAQSSRSTMHKFWPALPHSQHILFIVRLRQKWHDMDMAHDLCFVSPPCSTSCDRATPYVNGAAFAVPVSNSALEGSFRFGDIVKRRQLSHKPNMTKPISLPREETS